MKAFLPRLFHRPPMDGPAWIEVDELQRRLAGGNAVVLVDVRQPGEFIAPPGHLPGAVNMPLADLPRRVGELAARQQSVVLVCKTDRRSAQAATELFAAGYGMSPSFVAEQTGGTGRGCLSNSEQRSRLRAIEGSDRRAGPLSQGRPTDVLIKRHIQGMTELSRIRKRQLEPDAVTGPPAPSEIDIVGGATIAYSSEDPAHPVEHMFDGHSGPGATRWISAHSDTVERIVVEFDQPQAISRLVYEVEEELRERTQQVRAEVPEDGGRTYRQIFAQDYTFSPAGATYQREEQRFNRVQASHLRLTIVPNKNGSGPATLTAVRLFA